jgi:hypothetical protein
MKLKNLEVRDVKMNWRMTAKISWADRVRDEVLDGVKVDRNVLHTTKGRKVY